MVAMNVKTLYCMAESSDWMRMGRSKLDLMDSWTEEPRVVTLVCGYQIR